jgi:hypothetical protein
MVLPVKHSRWCCLWSIRDGAACRVSFEMVLPVECQVLLVLGVVWHLECQALDVPHHFDILRYGFQSLGVLPYFIPCYRSSRVWMLWRPLRLSRLITMWDGFGVGDARWLRSLGCSHVWSVKFLSWPCVAFLSWPCLDHFTETRLTSVGLVGRTIPLSLSRWSLLPWPKSSLSHESGHDDEGSYCVAPHVNCTGISSNNNDGVAQHHW